jgi:hypothetical protein
VVLVAAICGVAVGAGTLAWAAQNDSLTEFGQVNPSAVRIRQQSAAVALAEASKKLTPGVLVSASLGASPSARARQGTWLYVTVAAPAVADGQEIESLWEADLLQGVLAESQSGGQGNLADAVVGSSFSVKLPDGVVVPDVGGGAGDVRAGQTFGGETQESDEVLIQRVKDALASHGLQSVEVRMLRVGEPAALIVAQVTDPSAIHGDFEGIREAVLGSPIGFEGLYLEIRDASGKAFVRTSTAYRTGAGRLWVQPGLDDVVGVSHG